MSWIICDQFLVMDRVVEVFQRPGTDERAEFQVGTLAGDVYAFRCWRGPGLPTEYATEPEIWKQWVGADLAFALDLPNACPGALARVPETISLPAPAGGVIHLHRQSKVFISRWAIGFAAVHWDHQGGRLQVRNAHWPAITAEHALALREPPARDRILKEAGEWTAFAWTFGIEATYWLLHPAEARMLAVGRRGCFAPGCDMDLSVLCHWLGPDRPRWPSAPGYESVLEGVAAFWSRFRERHSEVEAHLADGDPRRAVGDYRLPDASASPEAVLDGILRGAHA